MAAEKALLSSCLQMAELEEEGGRVGSDHGGTGRLDLGDTGPPSSWRPSEGGRACHWQSNKEGGTVKREGHGYKGVDMGLNPSWSPLGKLPSLSLDFLNHI